MWPLLYTTTMFYHAHCCVVSPALGSHCSANEFACDKEAACIDFGLTCDGYKHCLDGRDENKTYCSQCSPSVLTFLTLTHYKGHSLKVRAGSGSSFMSSSLSLLIVRSQTIFQNCVRSEISCIN